jgi:hypothetical protein
MIRVRLRSPRERWSLPYTQIKRVEPIDEGRRSEGLAVVGRDAELKLTLGRTQARALRELIASSKQRVSLAQSSVDDV